MAKNYKVRAKARPFKGFDSRNDMGLRAYAEQQKTIINAAKLNNKEFEATRKEFIDADILKSAKEEANRKELKKLEDDVYDVKFQNTKIRAEREIQALEQKEKEALDASKFWLNFSSTYAKQYTQAAQTIAGAIDLKRAQNSVNDYYLGGKYHQNIENSNTLDVMSLADMQKAMEEWKADPSKSREELNQIGAQFEDIKQRKWSTRNEGIIALLKEDWEKIKIHAVQTVGERFKVTTENIQDVLNIRGLELLNQAGIPWNSKAGIDFMKFVGGKAHDEFTYRDNKNRVVRDQQNIQKALERYGTALKNGDKYKKEFALNDISFLIQNQMVEADGKFGIVPMNEKEGLIATVQALVKAGIISTEDQIDDILQTPFPGQDFPTLMGENVGVKDLAKIDTRVSWDTRYKGTDLRETLLETAAEVETEKNKDKQKIKNSTDRVDKIEIDKGLSKKPNEEGYIDLRNKEQMQILKQKYKGRGNGKAYEYLLQVEILGNIGVNDDGAILNSEAITALAGEGKLAEFKRIIGLLPEETQAIYAPMIEGYEFAERVGWNVKGRTAHLKTALGRIAGIEDVTKLPADSDFNMMFADAEQVLLNLINKYDHRTDLNDVQKKQAIADDLRELIGEKDADGSLPHGSSIFRRKVVGGKIKWLAYHDEDGDYSQKEIDKLVTKGTENFLNAQKNDKTRLTIFTVDELDTLEKSSLTGNMSLPIPKRVKDLVNTLWEQQPKKDTTVFKTETMILNELLQDAGSKVVIPPTAEDRNLFLNKKYEVLIPNYLQMSREDQERVTCAQTILKLNDTQLCKDRARKENRENRLRREILEKNLSPNLRKDGSGDRWDTLTWKEQLEFEKLLQDL